MTSMQYCAFEKTVQEMKQVVGMLQEVDSFEELDHSDYEKLARSQLYYLCHKYIRAYNALNGGEDDE